MQVLWSWWCNSFRALRDEAADLPEMSLDEINAEINAVRAERRSETDE